VEFLLSLHRFWQYIVLIAAIVALVGAVAGWLGALPPSLSARRAGLLYIIALDIQLVIGAILWLGLGPGNLPTVYRYEHPTTMLLAIIVAHAGQVLARRAADPRAAARTVAIAVAVSLIVVLVGLPGVLRGR
jgi:hypothetical protein